MKIGVLLLGHFHLGVLPGDWEEKRKANLRLSMIEPVAEGMFQLFCQGIILYIVIGPGENMDNGKQLLWRWRC